MDLTMPPASPTLVWSPHPVLAAAGRAVHREPFLPGESIADYLRRLNIDALNRPVALFLNDRHLPREHWATTCPRSGDLITVRALVQHGGDSSKVLRTVLTIAVLVYAPQFAAQYSLLGTGIATTTALFSIGGSLLINALLPPPTPALPQAQGLGKESPTYSITGGQNRARPFEPLPLIVGTHRFYPDPDSKPYTDFKDGEQYLYQTFNFGLNGDDLAISDHRIGDTALSSFADFDLAEDLETSSTNGRLKLFPANVDTLSVGVTLTAPTNLVSNGDFEDWSNGWTLGAGWVINKGGIFSGDFGKLRARAGEADSDLTQNIATSAGNAYLVKYTLVNYQQGTVRAVVGGTNGTLRSADGTYVEKITAANNTAPRLKFTAAAAFTGAIDDVSVISAAAGDYTQRTSSDNATALAVDLVGLLFYAGDNGLQKHTVQFLIEYCPSGTGSWAAYNGGTGIVTLTNSDRSQVRKTVRWKVPEGQYDVRVLRITPDEGSERYTSEFAWTVLRSYQPDSGTYANQKRQALRIRASGNLNGAIDAYNVLAAASCEAWTGSAWSKTANSNPAWWFRWFARGKTDAGGAILYGCNYSDSRIDIDTIKDWGAWCASKGLTVNLVVDRAMSRLEVLQAIARCGRASVTWSTGKLGVIWDADDEPITAQFGMANIIRDSFRIEYITGPLADEVVVEFINEDLDYQPDSVRATVPGVTNPVRPVTVRLWGVTNGDQAGREANLTAAEQFYRRRRIVWESDFEAVTVRRGSVVLLTHDLTQWSYSGRLVAGTTTVLTLDREVPFTVGEDHYVLLRAPDGTFNVYDVTYQAGASDTLTLTSALPAAPDTDKPVDWLWFFAPLATPGKKVKIIDAKPIAGASRIRLTATDEDPDYYAAEDGEYNYAAPSPFGSAYPTLTDARVSDTLILVGHAFATLVTVSWTVTGDYAGAWVRWRLADEKWQILPSTPGREVQFQAPAEGELEIEITAFNRFGKSGANSRATPTHTIVGDDDPMGDVTNFTAAQNGAVAVLSWDEPDNIDRAGYEVRRQTLGVADWDTAALVLRTGRVNTISTANIPPGEWTLLIKGFDHNDPPIYSDNAAGDDIEMVNTNDIVDSVQYAPDWPAGVLSGLVRHWTGVLVPQDQYPASAYGWELFDQAVPTPVPLSYYESPETDIGVDNTVRVWGEISAPLLVGETDAIDAVLLLDSRLEGDSYDGFEDWTIGDRAARYFKARVQLDNTAGVRCLAAAALTLDLQERTESWDDQDIDVAGTTLTFAQPFHRIPWIACDAYDAGLDVRITAVNSAGGLYVSCTVKIFTANTNTSVGGTARVIKARGV